MREGVFPASVFRVLSVRLFQRQTAVGFVLPGLPVRFNQAQGFLALGLLYLRAGRLLCPQFGPLAEQLGAARDGREQAQQVRFFSRFLPIARFAEHMQATVCVGAPERPGQLVVHRQVFHGVAVRAAVAFLHNELTPLLAGNAIPGVHNHPSPPAQPVLGFQ